MPPSLSSLLPVFLPFVLLHLHASLTHATFSRATSLSRTSSVPRNTNWNRIECRENHLSAEAPPGTYISFANDCYRALGKLPPPTILYDDFLLPTTIHSGNCAVSIERHPPHDTTPPPRDPAMCMRRKIWPQVRAIGRHIVRICVTQRKTLSGCVSTKTKCDDGTTEHAYTIRVKVATREQRLWVPIHIDRTPQVGTPSRRSPPR